MPGGGSVTVTSAVALDEADTEAARTLAFIAASESSHIPYLRDLRT